MTTIKFVLGSDGALQAARDIRAYKALVKKKTKALLKVLTDNGIDIVQAKIVEYGAVYTGELLSGVTGYVEGNKAIIRVTSDYAVFVEFGTGVVGQSASHPSAEALSSAAWQYASGDSIFTTESGLTGWVYKDRFGEFHFTEGMESRPFMYKSAEELRQKLLAMAQEVFNNDK